MKLQLGFEEALRHIGIAVRGGNLAGMPCSDLAEGQPAGNVAWVDRDMGIFVVDCAASQTIELDTLARRDVIVCSAVLNENALWTDFAVGDRRFGAKSTDMTMVFVPQGERFRFATNAPQDLKAVTLVVDVMSMMEAHGLPAATLPQSLLQTIRGGQIAMDTLVPGHFGTIARDVTARRAMFPSLAPLYYESKALELVSALMSEVSRRDAAQAGDGAFDPGILERLGLVKQLIDEAPQHFLDIDALARIAAMNRTKLRSSFKQVFGTTLSGYRSALMLQRADRALKEAGASVKQAAHHAGYATTSSFIVAYKRRYGVRPGVVARD